MTPGWRAFVDRGGTFTDVVAVDPRGAVHVRKVPASAPLVPVLRALSDRWDEVRVGTTAATNALLERRGASVALLTTRGLGDVLEIGTQARPELFALRIEKPAPLQRCAIELDERVLAEGTVETALRDDDVRHALRRAREAGCDAVAVALVHAWTRPDHERRVAELAREAGVATVVTSSECDPAPGFLARAETAVIDALVTPPLRRHVEGLRRELPEARLRFMTSSGGLAPPDEFRGRDALLSGPAGGAVALGFVASEAGCDEALGLDMGGTSTDVSRWSAAEDVDRVREREVAGFRLRVPMVDVVTVAAGGGSVLGRTGGRLTAGPQGAGSDPGPAAYARGGPATITDANVVLGRVQARWFPSCAGASGDAPLDAAAAERAVAGLAEPLGLDPVRAALGWVRVADEEMSRALRRVSLQRGRDPRRHALVAFGGAAPQHACSLATLLGIPRVLLHPLAGVLSAAGIGLAPLRREISRAMLRGLDDSGAAAAAEALDAMASEAAAALKAQGARDVACARTLELRHRGVESTLAVPAEGDAASLRRSFEQAHERLYGFRREELPAEIVAARVEATASLAPLALPALPRADGPPRVVDRVALWTEGPVRREVDVVERASLRPGHELRGPLLIADATCTIVLDDGWTAAVLPSGTLDLERNDSERPTAPARDRAVRLAVFGSRFMGIASEMGEALRRTAQSPNMKERLDFSCAIFTRDGRLVANAPHVPVHLGAMGETVRAILGARGEVGLRDGMAILSNDPSRGGSHLPDVTVVSPVHGASGRLAFFVANRGHHADVGGIVPGSMPPFATSASEEGVVLHDVLAVSDGRFLHDEVAALLAEGPHPVRGIPERLADLRAQAAANATGARLLRELCASEGEAAVAEAMDEVVADAAEACRELLRSLPHGTRRFEDALDDGSRIAVTVTLAQDAATFDFTGSAGPHAGSLNAPPSVTRACVLYALRCLMGREIPLNEGVLLPVTLVLPAPSILAPPPGAATCGGNVETSMRVADVILAALGAQAASQGTMNNLTFGDDSFGAYETIGGGSGAGPGFGGASAVHSHLTNTRLTDVEILEARAPVIVREISIRRGTGGRGRFSGGDGMVRALELRRPLRVTILSERRVLAPFGLEGGGEGARGRNVLRRAGVETDLGGKATVEGRTGDVIIVATPGGGGWGQP